ncbi:hypothetical protein FKM82_022725 [Ascaphus truei]
MNLQHPVKSRQNSECSYALPLTLKYTVTPFSGIQHIQYIKMAALQSSVCPCAEQCVPCAEQTVLETHGSAREGRSLNASRWGNTESGLVKPPSPRCMNALHGALHRTPANLWHGGQTRQTIIQANSLPLPVPESCRA